MDPLASRVAARVMTSNVVPFRRPPKGPHVPTVEISGHHYVLSTDGGPLGDAADPQDHGWLGQGDHARLIKTPSPTNKWRYLWAYDTEKQNLGMWRASDGNEKVYGSAHTEQGRIVRLEKRGELNRVTSAQMKAIEAEMRKREQAVLQSLKESIAVNLTDFDRKVGPLAQEFFDRYGKAPLERALSDIRKGVIPIGFKPFGPGEDDEKARFRQMAAYVMGVVFRREMGKDKFESFVRSKGLDPDQDLQAVHWALDEVYDRVLDAHLPTRP